VGTHEAWTRGSGACSNTGIEMSVSALFEENETDWRVQDRRQTLDKANFGKSLSP